MIFANKTKNRVQFRCRGYRTTGCTCQMKMNCVGNVERTGDYLPECYHKTGVSLPKGIRMAYSEIGLDYKGEMHTRVAKLAQETRDVPNKIWENINLEFIKEYGENYQGLRKDQVTKLVYNERRAEVGVDDIGKLKLNTAGGHKWHFSVRALCFMTKTRYSV